MTARNVTSRYGDSIVVAGEGTYLHAPLWAGFKADNTQRPLMVFHGRGGTAGGQIASYFSLNSVMATLVRFGWLACAADFGGTAPWGNASMETSAVTHMDYMTTGAMNGLDQVDLLGWSLGGFHALILARLYPSRIRRVTVFCPATSLAGQYALSAQSATEIEAAWGGAAWATNSAGRDPISNPAAYRTGPSVRIYHGDADTTVPIQHSRDFVAAVNNPNVALHELPGMDHTNLFGAVDPTHVADFLWGKVAA